MAYNLTLVLTGPFGKYSGRGGCVVCSETPRVEIFVCWMRMILYLRVCSHIALQGPERM